MGHRTPYFGDWPVRVDERIIEEPDRWVQSACVFCSNGCGMDIGVKDGLIVGVRGRAVDAVSSGRLGPKGLYGWVANDTRVMNKTLDSSQGSARRSHLG